MILDARLQEVPIQWTVQVAIVGAGPAGLTLARELAGVAQVLVIEAGGLEIDPDQQALLAGECAGMPYPLTETRARQFGGSSGLWAGYCAQLDSHDFAVRDWVPLSGWPFGIETIQPYYSRVAELLNLGEPEFDARDIARRSGDVLPFDNDMFVPTVWRFGTPTQRFGDSLRAEFDASPDITTLLHASVADIRIDAEHSGVTELVIRTSNGREGRVSADLFILACGGIETPRLLLNSDSQVSHGLGNSSGLVGRCFMEHPHRAITPLVVHASALESWTRRAVYDGNKQFAPCVGLSKESQEVARVMNARAHVYRTPAMNDNEAPKVGLFVEQAPNLDSQVRLCDTRDPLGMRRVCLDWRLTELDTRTYEKTAYLIASEFERLGVGSLTEKGAIAGDRETVLHSNHHLGTTRMAEARDDGVVDADCRVHDLSNLYIIGGSIFPTVSWANPTFTLMALTFRLANYLKSEISQTRP